MATAALTNAAWVQKAFSEILVSPHIHFTKPAGLAGIRLGPGPIDLFSTRFNNYIAKDVEAVVAGETVSRDQLKDNLLGWQQHYEPDKVESEVVQASDNQPAEEVYVKFMGQAKDIGAYEVSINASVDDKGGSRKMSSIVLGGDPRVFTKASVQKDTYEL